MRARRRRGWGVGALGVWLEASVWGWHPARTPKPNLQMTCPTTFPKQRNDKPVNIAPHHTRSYADAWKRRGQARSALGDRDGAASDLAKAAALMLEADGAAARCGRPRLVTVVASLLLVWGELLQWTPGLAG